MGVVYRAEDTDLRRTVALKFLPEKNASNPRVGERLRREARTASALNHPNICTIYEVGEDAGEVFIAMEYVEGRPLLELIRAGLPSETLLRHGRQLASALAHAHDHGVIHGDLKPLNIVVTSQGDAKILDFGLARRRDPAEFDKQTLQPISAEDLLSLGGTLPYMAPEQLQGSDASPCTDIWSLGVVLYEMAAGTRPFKGDNFYQLCSAICKEAPPPLPPQVSPGLATVISRCLEKEPARRYHRASEVHAALEALTASPFEIRDHTPLRAAPPRAWRLRLAIAGLILLFAAGLFLSRGKFSTRNALAAVPAQALLGVLPPLSSGDASQAAFEGGLADTLNSRLGELSTRHALSVIPMNAMLEKHVTTIDAARQQFGVNLVLVLKVQRAGADVRVNYALVDARSQKQLRGGTITAAASDPFLLQDRVFGSVAEAMELQLAPQEKNSLASRGTTEPAAYDFYVQGRGYLQDYVVPEKVEDAIVLFQRALEKDPAYAAATAGLGEAYWRKYQLTHDIRWADEAIESCQTAAKRGPTLVAAHLCLGRVYSTRGDYQRAAEQYKRAVELEPSSDEAYGGLAPAYEQLGRTADAEQSYKQAIAVRPSYWAPYNWLGLYYMRHARYPEAATMYTQVVSLAPDSFVGYSNLGAIRILQGQYSEAVPFLDKSLSIRPTADARSNLATAYFQMHRYPESAANFEAAVKLNPKNYILWGNLADAYYWAPGRRSDADTAYARAIALGEEQLRLNPNDAQLLSSLAMYHAMRGDRKPALEKLNASLHLQPKSPDMLLNAGITYEQLGDTSKALDALEKAVSYGISPQILADTPNFEKLQDNARFRGLLGGKQTK